MKILSIGNSFSRDAQRYLHRLALQDGENIKTVNLFIGGCSLEEHDKNILNDNAVYGFDFNGESTGIKVSIKQALDSDDWDYITLQQASRFSVDFSTYTPYLDNVAKYVRYHQNDTKILIHNTWAYEDESEKLVNLLKYEKATDMLCDVNAAYKKAAERINAAGIIPCGTAMMNALNLGINKIHCDGYHASLGAGRYLLALTWYKYLTQKNISNNSFNDFDELVTEEERKIVIQAVNNCFK